MKHAITFYAMLLCSAVAFSQNIGIGTVTPQEKLDVNGAIRIGTTATTNAGTVRFTNNHLQVYSGSAWINLDSSVNMFGWLRNGNAGTNPATDYMGTSDNTALSFKVNNAKAGSLDPATYAAYFGIGAGNTSTGLYNAAIGYRALYTNTTGNYNIASGAYALYLNTTGANNAATGSQALYSNTSGSSNSADGSQALFANTTGNNNTACGYYALGANTIGNSNTACGRSALGFNTTGTNNAALGEGALNSNVSGYRNSALGTLSLQSCSTCYDNTASGYNALSNNLSGYQNVATGVYSMFNLTTGVNNTALGYYAYYAGTAYNNSMALGANAIAISANNMVRVGDANITSVGGQVGWTTLSDARIKMNIRENVPGLAFIKELRPVTYNYNKAKENEMMGVKETEQWKDKDAIDKIQFSGFLAQEVDAAAAKTGYSFSGVDKTGDLWGLRYAEFVVPLVKAVQEQQAIIESLKKEIELLKSK